MKEKPITEIIIKELKLPVPCEITIRATSKGVEMQTDLGSEASMDIELDQLKVWRNDEN